MRNVLIAAVMLCTAALLQLSPARADCPDATYVCVKTKKGTATKNIVGTVTVGTCWKWSQFGCKPCDGYAKIAETCNNQYFDKCKECEPTGCAACVRWADTGGVAGPCYDYKGNKLMDGPPDL